MTSTPPSISRPVVGRSSPAMRRMSVVFPDNVGPSKTLIEPWSSVSETSSMTVSCPTESEIFSRTNVTRRLPPFDQLSVAEPATLQDRRRDLGPRPRTFAIPAWSAAKRCRQRSSPIRCWRDRGPRLRSGRRRKSDRDPIASSPRLVAFPPECHMRGRDGAPCPAREKDNAPPFRLTSVSKPSVGKSPPGNAS